MTDLWVLTGNDVIANSASTPHQVDQLFLRYIPQRHHRLVKYFFIGGMASAIDVGLFLVLFNLVGTTPLVAHSVSVPISVLFSFFFNARYNFRTNDHAALRLLSFIIVSVIGYLAGYGVISAVEAARLGANIGKIISLPVVFLVQYSLNSRITFRHTQPAAGLPTSTIDTSRS